MKKTLAEIRAEMELEIDGNWSMVSWNSFANIAEASLGKQVADKYRKAAISEGKWIKVDGKIYNSVD